MKKESGSQSRIDNIQNTSYQEIGSSVIDNFCTRAIMAEIEATKKLFHTIECYYPTEIVEEMHDGNLRLYDLMLIMPYIGELCDAEDYDELTGALRMFYMAHNIPMPCFFERIFESGDDDLNKFFYDAIYDKYDEIVCCCMGIPMEDDEDE